LLEIKFIHKPFVGFSEKKVCSKVEENSKFGKNFSNKNLTHHHVPQKKFSKTKLKKEEF
jgi:hypothetical protein